jgi:phospholipid/cholesterol/gamma-HCH transport system substrate-binding protein
VVILFAVAISLIFSGDGGHKYTLLFQTGGQLVPGNQVLVAGQVVGTVDSIDLTEDNQAAIKVTTNDPLREGTTAVIRSTSLSGVANRYISLTPGPNNSDEIPPGSTITGDDTTAPVDLDQLFNVFRAKERNSLKKFISGNATAYAGKSKLANRAYRFINPAFSTSTKLFTELSSDSASLQRLLVDGSQAFGAIADQRDDLTNLVTNANGTLQAIANRNNDLDRSLTALPQTLREANTTFVNLRATLDDLDPLVDASKPVAVRLSPFFRNFRAAAHDLVPTVQDLDQIIEDPGRNNDLVDLTRLQPSLAKIAVGPVFRHGQRRQGALPESATALHDGLDELAFFRAYQPELTGWFDDFGHSGLYDALGGASRAGIYVNLFAPVNGVLKPLLDPLEQSDAFKNATSLNQRWRCPGSVERGATWKPSPDFPCDASEGPLGP